MTLAPPPPVSGAPRRASLPTKPRTAGPVAPKVLFHAIPGWGKTTLAANAPSPLILTAPDETGYYKLLSAKRVPSVHAENVPDWSTLLGMIDELATGKHDFKSVWLDVLGGFARLCDEYVCNRDFKGDWGERGFLNYHKGYELSAQEWSIMLRKMETVNSRGITVGILAHTQIKTHQNPEGKDFDRYEPQAHPKIAERTVSWASDVLFGKFMSVVNQDGKGIGGKTRVVYAQHSDARVAKSQHGLPEVMSVSDDMNRTYADVFAHFPK